MKFASFDLESANAMPDNVVSYDEYFDELGISCAAVALTDQDDIVFWYSEEKGPMPRHECKEVVEDLQQLVKDGYTIVTWNGTSFDFRLLAIESGMFEECANLALHHIDMMLYVTFTKGWRLGLQAALEGAGLEGKLHEVTLNDGTIITDMGGAKAPAMWEAGEREAVLSYLEEDVIQPLNLIHHIANTRTIDWISGSGNAQSIHIARLYTAVGCFSIKQPDTSWMTDSPTREGFFQWMPNWEDKIKC